ncbi:MAG: tetratricopeptide repeat protein [Pirellulales bacterium]|nr:tetratricopeptide repeat protein [Pirellulales bacterium]
MARLPMGLGVVTALAVVCVLLGPGVAPAEPLSVDSLTKTTGQEQTQIPEVTEAFNRLKNGDMDGAHASLKEAVKKHPELPPAEVLMAEFFMLAKQEPMARGWLERAIHDTPGDPQAYVALGQDAMQANRVAEARLLLEKGVEVAAAFQGDAKRKETIEAAALAALGRLAMGQQDWAIAQPHLEALLKLRPSDAPALQMYAQVLFELKKPDEALEKLRAAKAADDRLLTPEAIMAQWYERAKNHAKAGEMMVAALTAQPNDFNTRLAAADWAFNSKDFTQARQQIDIAIKTQPDSIQANLLAGNIAIFQKDFPAAEKYLKTALDAAPSNFATSNNLAVALAEQNDPAKQRLALQYAQINARLYPNDAEPFSTLGRVLFRLGQLGEAEQSLNKAATIARNNGKRISPDTGFYIAEVFAATNRKDEAKKILQDALAAATGLFSSREDAEALLERLSQ